MWDGEIPTKGDIHLPIPWVSSANALIKRTILADGPLEIQGPALQGPVIGEPD